MMKYVLGLLPLVVYVAGWVFTYRATYIAIDTHDREWWPSLRHDGEDRLINSISAAFVAFIWPVTGTFLLIKRYLTPVTPGEREDRLRERERAAEAREERIRQMEREAGIR